MSSSLVHEHIWADKFKYNDAERRYYEKLAKAPVTPLADEVAKARQRLIEIRDTYKPTVQVKPSVDAGAVKFLEKRIVKFKKSLLNFEDVLKSLEHRVSLLESHVSENNLPTAAVSLTNIPSIDIEEDDGVDLFASDSEEETEDAQKVREERLASYTAKKSAKPLIIAKSNIIFDVKPWDDETDMQAMETEVRKIETDGLLWGAAKLVPLAYGIHKLQISCVVEDDKVSVDWLQEKIESVEDYVQSVDIAAFNKV